MRKYWIYEPMRLLLVLLICGWFTEHDGCSNANHRLKALLCRPAHPQQGAAPDSSCRCAGVSPSLLISPLHYYTTQEIMARCEQALSNNVWMHTTRAWRKLSAWSHATRRHSWATRRTFSTSTRQSSTLGQLSQPRLVRVLFEGAQHSPLAWLHAQATLRTTPDSLPLPLHGAAAPAQTTASTDNPFGKAPTSSPFGAAATPRPFKSSIEPKGLTPDLGPDPLVKEKPFNLLENINVTQVVRGRAGT